MISALQQELEVLQDTLKGLPLGEYDIDQLRHTLILGSFSTLRSHYKRAIGILSRIEDIEVTLRILHRYKKRFSMRILSESSESPGLMSAGDASTVQRSVNMTDVLGDSEEKSSAGPSLDLAAGQDEMLAITEFLSRPVPLTDYTLTLGADSMVVVPVWDTITLNPAVRAKLRNYAYLKADMKVRIAISGSPFHYGRLMASYQPYPERNANIQAHLNNIALDPVTRILFLNYLSQAKGAATIDVKANEPLEISIPFISTKPMHRLFNSATTAIGTGTSFDDLSDAGSLYLMTIAPPGSVSTGSSDLSVYVYGWFENISLGTATGTNVAIVTESSVKTRTVTAGRSRPSVKKPPAKDERKRGPFETVASYAADVSKSLAVIPQIEPFAMASSMVFGTIRDVSSMFGWSKPGIISDPTYVKNNPYQNPALGIGRDTSMKIALDGRQELSIDPSPCGTTDDDLAIQSIASVPSYFASFNWTAADTQLSSLIWSCQVTPNLNTVVPVGSYNYFQPTAMAFAADPFQFWRGDITFRFEIVCSAFHRGKLAFFFDPNYAQLALIDAALSLNKQYIKIVDIQETQLVEFTVEWAYPRMWCKTQPPSMSLVAVNPQVINAAVSSFMNGFIGVSVFNRLQSPDDSDISINCYAYCHNLRVNNPTEANLSTRARRIIAESRTVEIVSESKVNHPEAIYSTTFNDSSASSDGLSTLHFGEEPLSFRTLMKRFVNEGVESINANGTAPTYITNTGPWQPMMRSSYAIGSSTAPLTPLNYLRYAFLGLKGSIRYQFKVSGIPSTVADSVTVAWQAPSTTWAANSVTIASGAVQTVTPLQGGVTYVIGSNGGIEFELPLFTNNLFLFSFADDFVGTNPTDDMELQWLRNYSLTYSFGSATPASRIYIDYSLGDDFSFMRFQGAPYFTVAAP